MRVRLPFMLFAFVNLLAGMLAGLIRIGWEIDISTLAVHHGSLMVGGFLGTLILLEKVIPLRRRLLYIFPAINTAGIIMVVPGFHHVGQGFLLAGAVGLLIVFVIYFLKQPKDLSTILMALGSCCLIAGHLMLIWKQFYPMAFPWWMGCIFFVIVGERLELSRFLPVTKQDKHILIACMFFFLLGLLVPFHGVGKYISGFGLTSTGLWLLRHDVISIGLKKDGLTRFSAFALLIGCLALVLTGVLLISLPDLPYAYDATVHTFFLGFAFSMIFAHGPIILPGVLGLNVKPYHSILYVPLFGLTLSLILRLFCDLSILPFEMRLWSGFISVVCILGYFLALAITTLLKIRSGKAV